MKYETFAKWHMFSIMYIPRGYKPLGKPCEPNELSSPYQMDEFISEFRIVGNGGIFILAHLEPRFKVSYYDR